MDRKVGIKLESWTGKWGSSLIGGLESGGIKLSKLTSQKSVNQLQIHHFTSSFIDNFSLPLL